MDFELSAREKELSTNGREFCDQVLVPLEIVTDEHGELPMDRRDAVQAGGARLGPGRHQSHARSMAGSA